MYTNVEKGEKNSLIVFVHIVIQTKQSLVVKRFVCKCMCGSQRKTSIFLTKIIKTIRKIFDHGIHFSIQVLLAVIAI